MEVYKFIEQPNGDIILEKVTIDKNMYIVIQQPNGDKLLQKKILIQLENIDEIKNYDFTKSNILDCRIEDSILVNLKYKILLQVIYEKINDGVLIIKNSLLNIKTIKKQNEGFYYLEEIGISVQGADSNRCMSEIINQCVKNNLSLKMKIRLNDGTKINISI